MINRGNTHICGENLNKNSVFRSLIPIFTTSREDFFALAVNKSLLFARLLLSLICSATLN
jgi:hypothetical protein